MNSIWNMPTAAPETVGIPSAAIQKFLTRLENRGVAMHDALIMRHDTLVSETYWKPFDQKRFHRMFSTTKSFTSAAIGILIGDGKLQLNDRISDYFTDLLPGDLHPWTRQATIRDLLRMATSIDITSHDDTTPDWAASFFHYPVSHIPGQIFRYDTSASSTLSILVERLSGMKMTEFLRERLFIPAGMSEDIRCILTNCGHDWGGSGLLCTPRDLMRFAQVCMRKGSWDGRQLIPEWYMTEATQKQIDNSMPNSVCDKKQGYGYQFWCLRRGAFATCGMGRQDAYCLPEKDLIVVLNADAQPIADAADSIYEAYWEMVDSMSDQPLAPNPAAELSLRAHSDSLALLCAKGATHSPTADRVSGLRYALSPNHLGFKNLSFTFKGNEGQLSYENATGAHTLGFGFGRQVMQPFPETHYYGEQIGTPAGRGYDCFTSAAWCSENTLSLECRVVDIHVGTLYMQFAFTENTVTLYAIKYAEWFFQDYTGFASGSVSI